MMATVRRLSIREHTIPRLQAVLRPSHPVRVPLRRYWISRPGESHVRARIYNRDSYYARWLQERDIRQARLCGSWTRRKLRDHAAASQGKGNHEKSTSESSSTSESKNKETVYTPAEEFSRLLEHRHAEAYKFIREIEKDPYRWLFDPYNTKSAWNPSDWWKKHHDRIEKRWAQREMSNATPSSDQNTTASIPSTPEKNTAATDEYVIDPITLKKVFVQNTTEPVTDTTAPMPSYTKESVGYDIPVKRQNNAKDKILEERLETTKDRPINSHVSATLKTSYSGRFNSPRLSGFANQPWLVKEGFTALQQSSSDKAAPNNSSKKETPVKIEPSLERVNSLKKASRLNLKYPLPEKTTDDVDLLRPEDIRAASGHIKTKDTPSPVEKEQRSKALRNNWQDASGNYSQDLLEVYSEVLKRRRSRGDWQQPGNSSGDVKKLSSVEFKKVKEHYNELQGELDQTRKVLEQARRELLHDMLTSEAKTVKESFESFETRPRNQISTATDPKISEGQVNNVVSKANAEEKQRQVEKLKRDQNLVSEIRNIYEQKYGTITTDHRQSNIRDEKIPNELSKAVPRPQHNIDTTVISSRPVQDPPQSVKSSQNDAVTSKPITDTSLRDLLYQNISKMQLSDEMQRRLKFALRGVSELDTIVTELQRISSVKPKTPEIDSFTATKPNLETSRIKETPVEHLRKRTTNKDEPVTKTNEKEKEFLHFKRGEEHTYLYKILALDNASGEVAVATTTSSIKHKASIPRSAAGILVHLDQPAKYFNHMEKLDSQGYKLVSGSRNMLVYRRRTDQDGLDNQASLKGDKTSNSGMKPLREEAVFSGPREPKERLLRSYQLAHRRARSNAQVSNSQSTAASFEENKSDETEPVKKESMRQKVRRGLMSRTAAVFLAVFICYVAGNLTAQREKREFEEGARKRREEAAARRMEVQKNDWKWF